MLKRVLRGFRRFYVEGFHECTNYRNLKKSNLASNFYNLCLTKYINAEFPIADDSQLVSLLERLIATNRNMPKDKLFEVLFKFNNKKLRILVANSQVRFLLIHYIESIDISVASVAEKLGIELITRECNKY